MYAVEQRMSSSLEGSFMETSLVEQPNQRQPKEGTEDDDKGSPHRLVWSFSSSMGGTYSSPTTGIGLHNDVFDDTIVRYNSHEENVETIYLFDDNFSLEGHVEQDDDMTYDKNIDDHDKNIGDHGLKSAPIQQMENAYQYVYLGDELFSYTHSDSFTDINAAYRSSAEDDSLPEGYFEMPTTDMNMNQVNRLLNICAAQSSAKDSVLPCTEPALHETKLELECCEDYVNGNLEISQREFCTQSHLNMHNELIPVQEQIDDARADDSDPNENVHDMDTIIIPPVDDSSMDMIGENVTVDFLLQEHLDTPTRTDLCESDNNYGLVIFQSVLSTQSCSEVNDELTPVKVPIDQEVDVEVTIDQDVDEKYSSNESICEVDTLNTSALILINAESSTGESDGNICVSPPLEDHTSIRVLYENHGNNPISPEVELSRSSSQESRELAPIKEMIDDSVSEELMHRESTLEMDTNVILYDDAELCTSGLGENPIVCSSFQDPENIPITSVELAEAEENSLFVDMTETVSSIQFQNEHLLSIEKSEDYLDDSLNQHECGVLSSDIISLDGCVAVDDLMREDGAIIFNAEYGNHGRDECRDDTDNILGTPIASISLSQGIQSLDVSNDPHNCLSSEIIYAAKTESPHDETFSAFDINTAHDGDGDQDHLIHYSEPGQYYETSTKEPESHTLTRSNGNNNEMGVSSKIQSKHRAPPAYERLYILGKKKLLDRRSATLSPLIPEQNLRASPKAHGSSPKREVNSDCLMHYTITPKEKCQSPKRAHAAWA